MANTTIKKPNVVKNDGNMNAILTEISTLLQDLNRVLHGEQTQDQSGEIEMATDQTDENVMTPDEEEKKVVAKKSTAKKGIEETPSDGATARDDAEEKVEDPLPEPSANNVDDVAKAMLKLLQPKPSVAKSSNDKNFEVMKQMATALQTLASKQNDTEQALMNVLKHTGLADAIEKQYKLDEANKVQKGLTNASDTDAILGFLKKALGEKAELKQDFGFNNQATEVHKTLATSDVLRHLVYGNK